MKENLHNGMGIYTTSPYQTLFDVSVAIHGTIDGIADLLINNKDIDINQKLESGTKLFYTNAITLDEQTVNLLDSANIKVANGESNIYPKYCNTNPIIMDIFIKNDEYYFSLSKTEGGMIIDWGDDSELEEISPDKKTIIHNYMVSETNDDSDYIRIRIYSKDKSFGNLSIDSGNAVMIMLYDEIELKSYKDKSELIQPTFIKLCNKISSIDLSNAVSGDFGFIGEIDSLRDINITTRFTTPESMDNMFLSIVNNYSSKRLPANVVVSIKPNGIYRQPKDNKAKNGMEAVWLLVNSDEWNSEAYQWRINIDGKEYEKIIKEIEE